MSIFMDPDNRSVSSGSVCISPSAETDNSDITCDTHNRGGHMCNTRSMEDMFRKMQEERPLVHVISNYVTLHDVVNVILAAGAAAIAADDPQETEEISNISQTLYLNAGMPSDRKLDAMLRAGKAANAKGIPVVLDPVGAGSSEYRRLFLNRLLDNIRFTCIRGNASEIAALSGITFASKGVEAADVGEPAERLQRLADHLDCILAISGAEDQVVIPGVGGKRFLTSSTGSVYAKRITGCGCMLSGLIASFLALYPDSAATRQEQAELVHFVMTQYGRAQEEAEKRMREADGGTMTFLAALIDAVSGWG